MLAYQKQQKQQNSLKQSLKSSPLIQSRMTTPSNPLVSNNTSAFQRNKTKTHHTQKSRLQSIISQQYDKSFRQPVYKNKEFMLYDQVLGQGDAVFQYATGKPKKINTKLIYNWKDCLLHQDKTQIFVNLNHQNNQISYTHPRVFPLNQLQKGFQEVYGIGKNRCLKAGQQSLIIDGINRYLKKCDEQPMKIARKDFDIISEILVDTKLTQLEKYRFCHRQIEGHLKIMFTRWKYQNINNKSNRQIQAAIITGKNHFVDFAKHGILAEYLLKHSNKNQLQ